jgi:hypothetical protein
LKEVAGFCSQGLEAVKKLKKAVDGVAGRSALHPRLLISLWLYADSEGVELAPSEGQSDR